MTAIEPAASGPAEAERHPWMESLLERAVAAGASDVHLVVDEHPFIRVHNDLEPIEDLEKPSAAKVDEILRGVTLDYPHRSLEGRTDLDFGYVDGAGVSYRVSAFRERRGTSIAFRVIGRTPPTIDELGIERHVQRAAYAQGGLALFAGPAGTGKTTTMAAVLQELCRRRYARLITLEDPVEYLLDPCRAYVEQRGIGTDCESFEKGVQEALEAQPDVLAIGELRDAPTMRLALQAAETGMLVLATVHAYDATRTISRVVDAFPERERPVARVALSTTVRMIVAQTLLKTANGRGRVPATEVCFQSPSVSALIREGREHELPTVIESSRGRGMHTLDDSLVRLFRRGVIRREEAIYAAVRKEQVTRLLDQE